MAERPEEVKLLLSVLTQVGEDATRFPPGFIEQVMNLAVLCLEDAYPLPPPEPPVCAGQTDIYSVTYNIKL